MTINPLSSPQNQQANLPLPTPKNLDHHAIFKKTINNPTPDLTNNTVIASETSFNDLTNIEPNIPEGQDAIGFIEKTVKEASSKELKDCDFDVTKSNFLKNANGNIRAYAYRNPPNSANAPDCYYFIRAWSVSFKDEQGQTQNYTFTKKIFTNVQIPRSDDASQHEEAEYLAGMAASQYAAVVKRALLGKASKTSDLYDQIKDHVNKIQKDKFITMQFFTGKQASDKAKAITISDWKGKRREITYIRLNMRLGDPNTADNEPKEYKDSGDININLAKLMKKNGQQGNQQTFQKNRFSHKKYVLTATNDSPLEIKERAKLVKFKAIRQQLMKKPDKDFDLAKELKNNEINEDDFQKFAKADNEKLSKTFNDRLFLLQDKEQLQTVVNRYGEKNSAPISEGLKNKLPTMPSRLKKFFAKKDTSKDIAPILTKLNEIYKTSEKAEEKKEIENLLKHYKQMLTEMKKVSEEMASNEEAMVYINQGLKAPLEANKLGREEIFTNLEKHFTIINEPKALDDVTDTTVELVPNNKKPNTPVIPLKPEEKSEDNPDENL